MRFTASIILAAAVASVAATPIPEGDIPPLPSDGLYKFDEATQKFQHIPVAAPDDQGASSIKSQGKTVAKNKGKSQNSKQNDKNGKPETNKQNNQNGKKKKAKNNQSKTTKKPRSYRNDLRCDHVDGQALGLPQGSYVDATTKLGDYCSKNRCEQTTFYKSGDVVAFFCNFHNNPRFLLEDYNNQLGHLKDACMAYHGGSFSNGQDENIKDFSYGVTNWQKQSWCDIPAGSTNF